MGADGVGRIGNPSYAGELSITAVTESQRPGLIRSLVTPVNGRGRGLVAISVQRADECFTAAFLCDVRLGIRGVVGEAEPELRASRRFDRSDGFKPEGDCARDVPELALGLLAGA